MEAQMRRIVVTLAVLFLTSLFAGIAPQKALAAGTTTVKFVMPQTVDPPTKKILGILGSSIGASNTELDPNSGGVELHGRAQSTGANFNDIVAVRITFTTNSNVNVKSDI